MVDEATVEVTVEPEGDIRLLASPKKFLVSSKAVGLICRPLQAMMRWTQEKDEACKVTREIALEDDDPMALEIILNIAHLRFYAVPQHLEFEQLLSLATLTDKYGATRIIQPWIVKWTARIDQKVGKPGYEECSWIAWEFGLEAVLDRITAHFILNAEMDHDGKCVVNGEHLEGKQTPPGLLDSVLDVRHVTIERLLDIPYGYLNRLQNEEHSEGLCRAIPSRPGCSALTWGSLMLGLKRLDLGPIRPRAGDITTSVSQLSSSLQKFQIHQYHESDRCYDYRSGHVHSQCNVQEEMRARAKKVLEDIPSGLTAEHRSHVRVQKALLGVEKEK